LIFKQPIGHGAAMSRREAPELCVEIRAISKEAQRYPKRGAGDPQGRRECRALDAPAALRAKMESTQASHHGHTGKHPAFPAQWFYGFLRALLGDRALLPPSQAELPPPT
jgi:hypothetical protein